MIATITRIFFSLALLTALPSVFAGKDSGKRHADCIKTCDATVTVIQESDFKSEKGFIISEPGVYCLGEDITFNPAADRVSAITIAASDVVLDLNDKTLGQGNQRPNNIGIFVNRDEARITIRNGSINNFGALGIWLGAGSNFINVTNIKTSGCGNRGTAPHISLDSFTTTAIFAGGIGIGGLQNQRCSDIFLSGNEFLNTHSPLGEVPDPQNPNSLVEVIAAGIAGASADRVVVINNTTSNISSQQSTGRGITLTAMSDVLVDKHFAASVSHFRGGTLINVAASNQVVISDSIADDISDTGGVVLVQRGSVGIGTPNCTNVTISGSTAAHVVCNSSIGFCAGIHTRSSKNWIIENCEVQDCSSTSGTSTAAGVVVSGVLATASTTTPSLSDNGVIRNVKSQSNINSGTSGQAYGFNVEPLETQTAENGPITEGPNPSGIVITNSIAEGNTSAGFRFRRTEASSILNSVANSNGADGFLVSGASRIANPVAFNGGANTFESNVSDNNGTQGFRETGLIPAGRSTNMYISNRAFNNNANDQFNSINQFNAPRVTWVVGTAAAPAVNDIQNLSAHP